MRYVVIFALVALFVAGATLEDAKDAFLNATLDVEQARQEGLPHESLVDALVMMEESLSGKDPQRLRETALALNESDEARPLADRYFKLIDEAKRTGLKPGQNFTFVVETAQWIAERKALAFDARERLSVLERDVRSAEDGLNLSNARSAYESERFERVEGLVSETRLALEQTQVASARERALLALARRTVVGYVEQNWVSVLVFFVIFVAVAIFAFLELRVVYALRKISSVKREFKVAHEMLVGAQRDYYEGRIGRVTYKSRLDQQHERSRSLQAELNGWMAIHEEYKHKSVFARFRRV